MANENGEWIMHGVSDRNPSCIKTMDRMIDYINEVGFLPLFKNEVEGFSVEEHTNAKFWWTDHERDPWLWRELIARSGKIAYGKFFDKKTGFISLKWLPYFVNYRRDGYDFDSRWDDEKASYREKKIMDCFSDKSDYFSHELKETAGFGKGGEKNFDGIVTALQMQTYLVMKDLRKRHKKDGTEYGWSVAIYSTPEAIWGKKVTSAYKEDPEKSKERIYKQMAKLYPYAFDDDIWKAIRL